MYEWKKHCLQANASRCMHGVANMHDWPHFKLHLLTPICYINRLFNPVKRYSKAAITLCVNTSSYGVQLTRSWPTKEKKKPDTTPYTVRCEEMKHTPRLPSLTAATLHYLCFNLRVLCCNSSLGLKHQTEIHGADTNNLFIATDKDHRGRVESSRPFTSAEQSWKAKIKGEYIKDSGNVYIYICLSPGGLLNICFLGSFRLS